MERLSETLGIGKGGSGVSFIFGGLGCLDVPACRAPPDPSSDRVHQVVNLFRMRRKLEGDRPSARDRVFDPGEKRTSV